MRFCSSDSCSYIRKPLRTSLRPSFGSMHSLPSLGSAMQFSTFQDHALYLVLTAFQMLSKCTSSRLRDSAICVFSFQVCRAAQLLAYKGCSYRSCLIRRQACLRLVFSVHPPTLPLANPSFKRPNLMPFCALERLTIFHTAFEAL